MCVLASGGSGGGGGGGGHDRDFKTGVGDETPEFTGEVRAFDTQEETTSEVSLTVPAEALESLAFDECELHKEWKDSSSDE